MNIHMALSDDDKTKINVLLAEYNTLRSEAVARSGHRFNLMAIGIAAVTFLAGAVLVWLDKIQTQNNTIIWISVVVLLTVVLIGIWVVRELSHTSWRDLEKAVARVREIELQINDLLREDLLIWENLHGGSVAGYSGHSRPLPRSILADRRPPQRTFKGLPLGDDDSRQDSSCE
jgi:hypothetical protein